MINLVRILLLSLFLVPLFSSEPGEHITVYKKGVLHNFVCNEQTDPFVKHVFANWENDTFEVFDQAKDAQSIAIDLGAWIGTTAIWLSKNFCHVVAIEPDIESLKCLRDNLKASNCHNVSICTQPVSNFSQKVIFGPLGESLNESISAIKPNLTGENDYITKSITFKQMIFDFVYANETLAPYNISFIKCDIEGGEENILEDLLYFAYHNKCKVYLSFHLDWWQSQNLSDFEYLFKFFKTDCPINNLVEYIKGNPFTSIYFEPLEGAGIMEKKNIPAVIIGYNLYSYVSKMVKQLERYTSDIIIVDNASTYPKLLNYYKNEFKYTLLRQKKNLGHVVYLEDSLQNLVGNTYLLTDPDLLFNINLPENFIEELKTISDYYSAYKVGFALCIDALDIRTDIPIKQAEMDFWTTKMPSPPNMNLSLYAAPIDTTFSLVNKSYHNLENEKKCIYNCIRVADHYTSFHLPWHKNFHDHLQPGEYESYLNGNISTHYFNRN